MKHYYYMKTIFSHYEQISIVMKYQCVSDICGDQYGSGKPPLSKCQDWLYGDAHQL